MIGVNKIQFKTLHRYCDLIRDKAGGIMTTVVNYYQTLINSQNNANIQQ